MRVENLMAKNVRTCQRDDGLDVVAGLMWNFDCGSVPVVDDERRVIGMITDRDICMAALTQGRRLSELRVSGAMSWRVILCRPDETITEAADRMRFNQVRRLPVVDANNRLVGLLSLADIAREATREMFFESKEVPGDYVAATLAAVSRAHADAAAAVLPPSDLPLRPRIAVVEPASALA